MTGPAARRGQPDPRDERDARILDVIRALGEGEVTTYGDIAEVAGYPKLSRLVGRLLAASGESGESGESGASGASGDELPWWRVVNAAGRLVPGHEREQAALLRGEDVTVRDGRVVAAPVGRFARVSGSGRP